MTKRISFGTIILSACFVLMSCGTSTKEKEKTEERSNTIKHKIGVLLVCHGSKSGAWRQDLLNLEVGVKDALLSGGAIEGTRTAFMEYTEPSIATRLKELDSVGFTDVIIVPVFLTVSHQTFEDIPTIVGQKENPNSIEMLKEEEIERYTPKAKTYITPTLDFPDILRKNVLRRVESLSKNPKKEGLVLIGYGDARTGNEWVQLFDRVGEYVKEKKEITEYTYGWCGHIAHYNPDSTTAAINRVLKKKETALVVPILVAKDEAFQTKIIGGGVAKVKNFRQRVIYKSDAILPDTNINKWIVAIAHQYADKVNIATDKK